jgi:hypothetical protein
MNMSRFAAIESGRVPLTVIVTPAAMFTLRKRYTATPATFWLCVPALKPVAVAGPLKVSAKVSVSKVMLEPALATRSITSLPIYRSGSAKAGGVKSAAPTIMDMTAHVIQRENEVNMKASSGEIIP